ncbi:MAG: response regulator [Ignavibacteriales bacterium]|nr:response regulator [Ignavibacteriales bacterium]
MFGNKPTAEQQTQSHREQLSKHLRGADEHFRYNRFEEALTEIDKALALDPKSVLARSFKERIKMMQKRAHPDTPHEKTIEMSDEEKRVIISRLLTSAEECVRANDYKAALSKIAEVYKIDPQNAFARAYSDRIDTLQQEQQADAGKFFGIAKQSQPISAPEVHGAFFMYRELMKEVWADGKVTEDEAKELKIVRDLFGITDKEHFAIQRDVKTGAYLDALRLAWRDGVLTMNEQATLELMRQRYGITTEEHKTCLGKIEEAKMGMPMKETILIVDTDAAHRISLMGFLKKMNYDVMLASSVEEAFRLIADKFPNLVLAELMYSPQQQDGFSLFEKLQEHETLRNVPFFFMSRLKDGKVIRAALRLGLDLYFPKPVDQELLLAAVEGRLKKRM